MAVIHILKDGTRVDDIRGHVVKFADAEPLYRMMASMSTTGPKRKPNTDRKCAGTSVKN